MNKIKRFNWFKRITATLVALTVCATSPFLSGCIGRALSKNFSTEMRKNSNFEFGILLEITEEVSFEDYFIIPGFGVTGYVNKKYGEDYDTREEPDYVMYSVSSWPDVLSKKQYITGISCFDKNYTVYGLKIGDPFEKWHNTLQEKGFKEKDGRYYYNCIRINVDRHDEVVFSFSIYADSTNFYGVVF